MASGGYKGANVKVNDWVLVGFIALAGYFAYKMWVKPISDVTNAVGGAVSGGINAVETGVKDVINAGKSLLTGKNKTITGTPISPFDSPSKNYIPSDASLKALGYGNGQPSVQTNVANWNDLLPTASGQNSINVGAGQNANTLIAQKSLTTAKTAGRVVTSTQDASGRVTTSTGASYQVNVGSGTGSTSSSKTLKTLSPGVQNIKQQLSTAQSTKQPINLTSLGKGAIINLDTGDVRYK